MWRQRWRLRVYEEEPTLAAISVIHIIPFIHINDEAPESKFDSNADYRIFYRMKKPFNSPSALGVFKHAR